MDYPEKVFAYITHHERLLVFSHPEAPDAGLQVPAGTLEPGEHPEVGVLREAVEETGLAGLRMAGFLGTATYDMSPWGGDPAQRRYFFHLELEGEAPSAWRHYETSGGKIPPILFEFFWVPIPHGIPELIAGHGQMLPALFTSIHLSSDDRLSGSGKGDRNEGCRMG
jgi:8-oxo-dGTP pyrophosphatase MutT (NUDIX family)